MLNDLLVADPSVATAPGSVPHRRILPAVAGPIACLILLGALPGASQSALSSGFIENRGQLDEHVHHYVSGPGGAVYFTREALVVDLRQGTADPDRGGGGPPRASAPGEEPPAAAACAVWIRFAGASATPTIESRGELPTRYHYFLGNDPQAWRTGIPAHSELVYRDLWPGIDLVYRAEDRGISYELVLAPGADPTQVGFRYEGAERVIALAGGFRIETAAGSFLDTRPAAGRENGLVSWTPEDSCPAGPDLIPDQPFRLLASTFLGGSGPDYCRALVLDPSGNPVVAGWTASADFPATPGAYDPTHNGGLGDVFIGKLDATHGSLLWASFLGGGGNDVGQALALDPSGNPVITGFTRSSSFPITPAAYDRTYNGGFQDVFVSKLDASGSFLLWSTFLGGSDSIEEGRALAVDASGNVVVTGETWSSDFPTTQGAYDETHNGLGDVFIATLSASGRFLLRSSFLGGAAPEIALALALDPIGNPVVTGCTDSEDFPTTPGAYDESYNGFGDSFVSKLSTSGGVLLWSTFLGGSQIEEGAHAMAMDASGNPVVTGHTLSADFPITPGAFDESHNGDEDVFITKLSGSGIFLFWSTFLGGSGADRSRALALDPDDNPVVTGETESADFPTTPWAYDLSHNGLADVFVSELDASGASLLGSTFLGGGQEDEGRGLALDSAGNPVVSGHTFSGGFPTTSGAYDETQNGSTDGFVSGVWLTEASTVTVTLREGLEGYAGTDDNSMIDTRFRNNFGGADYFAIGKHTGDVEVTDIHRSLIRFDLAGIPVGAEILEARLELYNHSAESEEPLPVSAYRLTKHWVEGTGTSPPPPEFGSSCWDYAQLDVLAWSAPGASSASDTARNDDPDYDRYATPEATTVVTTRPAWYVWDLTGAVQQWVDGNWNNEGILLQAQVEDGSNRRLFHSSESAVDPDLRPTLVVTYGTMNPPPVAGAGGPEQGASPAPELSRLLAAMPNPSARSTAIRYELAAPGDVRLRIYDIRGRMVRVLVDGAQPAGSFEQVWDGGTATGMRATPGIYFYRLEGPGISETRKLVRVK